MQVNTEIEVVKTKSRINFRKNIVQEIEDQANCLVFWAEEFQKFYLYGLTQLCWLLDMLSQIIKKNNKYYEHIAGTLKLPSTKY